jgi:RES domain
MFAGFAGNYAYLRNIEPPPYLDPDPTIGYPAGHTLAHAACGQGVNGIIYLSVRHPGGTCLVALWPHALQSVAQGGCAAAGMAGTREAEVSEWGTGHD